MPSQQQIAELYVALKAQTAQFHTAMGEATTEMRNFSKNTRASMEEAKGSIVLLGEQIGVVLPRHLRTFVAGLPGVATAMSAAFDAVAIIALMHIVVEAGEKVYEFAHKNEEAARKNTEAWKTVAKPIQDTERELALANSKLEDTIAKLEHKPGDGLKSTLLEAADAADKLSAKLSAALDKMTALTQESLLEKLTGSGDTGDIGRTISYGAGQYKSITASYNDVLQRAASRGDTANYNSARADEMKALHAALDPQIATLYDYLRRNQDKLGTGDKSFEEARSGYASLTGLLNSTGEQIQGEGLNQTKRTLDAHAASGKDAATGQLQALQTQLDKTNAIAPMSAGETASFWKRALPQFDPASSEYREVLQHINEAASKIHEQITQSLAKIKATSNTTANEKAPAGYTISRDGTLALAVHGDEALDAANAKAAQSQAKLNAELTLAKDRLGLVTGAVSPLQAAMDAQAAHALNYSQQIAALSAELAKLRQNDDLAAALGGDPALAAKESQLKQQIGELQNQANIQGLVDAQNTLDQTWTGMVDTVFDELIRRSNDVSQAMQRIASTMVDGLNSEMAKAITGQKTNFSGVFQQAGTSVAKTGLESIEGKILGKFGLGKASKPDGTQSNPLYVKSVGGGIGGGSSSDLSSILGMPGGDGSGADAAGASSSSGGGAQGIFGSIVKFAGALFGGGNALGGDVAGGVPIDVGELGPERFVPHTSGTIIPNSSLGHQTHVSIDARGAGNPAEVTAAVHRAMIGYVPHITAASVAAVHDQHRRSPASRR